jgi:hypothetical protein
MHSKVTRLLIIVVSAMFCLTSSIRAQEEKGDIIQFSGKVLYEDNGRLIGAPFVNIYIKSDPDRGVYSNEEGFFSVVARKGETVVFSSIQFKTQEYEISDTLDSDRYTMYMVMAFDDVVLEAPVIYPWPSREHFDIEFLAMDVTEELRQIAEENLARQTLAEASENLLPDGDETADIYFQQYQQEVYSAGQFKPTNIMNPLAWQKFIKAWKDGKFKKKKN